MAYEYRKVKRKISLGKDPGEKYLAAMSVAGKKTNADLIEHIERNSSIAKEDITILFRDLAAVVEEAVSSGQGVKLDALGTFSPNIRTKSELKAEDITTDNIQKVVINFRPSAELRKAMDKAAVKESTQNKIQHI